MPPAPATARIGQSEVSSSESLPEPPVRVAATLVDEREQHGGHALVTVLLERLAREPRGLAALESRAPGPELVPDDGGVCSAAIEPLGEQSKPVGRVAARLVARRGGHDGDVERPRVRVRDPIPKPSRVGGGDRRLGVRIDVDGIGAERLRRLVEIGRSRRRGREGQDGGGEEDERAGHP